MTKEEFIKEITETTYLENICLCGAVLENLDLSNYQLRNVSFYDVRFYNVKFNNSVLTNTSFFHCFCKSVDFSGSHIRRGTFKSSQLENCNLGFGSHLITDFTDAHIGNCENVPFIPMCCPEEGSFVAWKSAFLDFDTIGLVKLLIPEDAKRSSATGHKCRCNKAKVLRITDLNETKEYEEAMSAYDLTFKYRVGDVVEVPNFDENRFEECTSGIHFFLNKQEAIDW